MASMSKLLALTKRLGKDAELETTRRRDREIAAIEYGCDEGGVGAPMNMDSARIGPLTGLKNGKLATDLSIKACDH
jgi:hypothetical protein